MVQNRHTFADAAYVHLLEKGESMHYKDLARAVLDASYFVSRGKTPEQTLRSQISREIRQQVEEARFVNEDAGVISLSEKGKNEPDKELQEFVHGFAERQKAKGTKAKPAKTASKAAAKSASKTASKSSSKTASKKAAKSTDSTKLKPAEALAKVLAKVAAKPDRATKVSKEKAAKASPAKAPSEAKSPEATPAVPATSPEAPAQEAPPKMAPASPDKQSARAEEDRSKKAAAAPAFIPVDLGEVRYDDEEDTEGDGTFATAQQEILVHDDPEDGEVGNAGVSKITTRLEEDTEQDFLSVGPDLRDMTSTVYNASMDELAPIVVPPHEGGAAEIARLPMGGRSVLIIKVVRRKGVAQIQLVEELESLISGVVGRLLLTMPGKDLPDLIEGLQTTQKVIEGSFVPEDADGFDDHQAYS